MRLIIDNDVRFLPSNLHKYIPSLVEQKDYPKLAAFYLYLLAGDCTVAELIEDLGINKQELRVMLEILREIGLIEGGSNESTISIHINNSLPKKAAEKVVVNHNVDRQKELLRKSIERLIAQTKKFSGQDFISLFSKMFQYHYGETYQTTITVKERACYKKLAESISMPKFYVMLDEAFKNPSLYSIKTPITLMGFYMNHKNLLLVSTNKEEIMTEETPDIFGGF